MDLPIWDDGHSSEINKVFLQYNSELAGNAVLSQNKKFAFTHTDGNACFGQINHRRTDCSCRSNALQGVPSTIRNPHGSTHREHEGEKRGNLDTLPPPYHSRYRRWKIASPIDMNSTCALPDDTEFQTVSHHFLRSGEYDKFQWCESGDACEACPSEVFRCCDSQQEFSRQLIRILAKRPSDEYPKITKSKSTMRGVVDTVLPRYPKCSWGESQNNHNQKGGPLPDHAKFNLVLAKGSNGSIHKSFSSCPQEARIHALPDIANDIGASECPCRCNSRVHELFPNEVPIRLGVFIAFKGSFKNLEWIQMCGHLLGSAVHQHFAHDLKQYLNSIAQCCDSQHRMPDKLSLSSSKISQHGIQDTWRDSPSVIIKHPTMSLCLRMQARNGKQEHASVTDQHHDLRDELFAMRTCSTCENYQDIFSNVQQYPVSHVTETIPWTQYGDAYVSPPNHIQRWGEGSDCHWYSISTNLCACHTAPSRCCDSQHEMPKLPQSTGVLKCLPLAIKKGPTGHPHHGHVCETWPSDSFRSCDSSQEMSWLPTQILAQGSQQEVYPKKSEDKSEVGGVVNTVVPYGPKCSRGNFKNKQAPMGCLIPQDYTKFNILLANGIKDGIHMNPSSCPRETGVFHAVPDVANDIGALGCCCRRINGVRGMFPDKVPIKLGDVIPFKGFLQNMGWFKMSGHLLRNVVPQHYAHDSKEFLGVIAQCCDFQHRMLDNLTVCTSDTFQYCIQDTWRSALPIIIKHLPLPLCHELHAKDEKQQGGSLTDQYLDLRDGMVAMKTCSICESLHDYSLDVQHYPVSRVDETMPWIQHSASHANLPNHHRRWWEGDESHWCSASKNLCACPTALFQCCDLQQKMPRQPHPTSDLQHLLPGMPMKIPTKRATDYPDFMAQCCDSQHSILGRKEFFTADLIWIELRHAWRGSRPNTTEATLPLQCGELPKTGQYHQHPAGVRLRCDSHVRLYAMQTRCAVVPFQHNMRVGLGPVLDAPTAVTVKHSCDPQMTGKIQLYPCLAAQCGDSQYMIQAKNFFSEIDNLQSWFHAPRYKVASKATERLPMSQWCKMQVMLIKQYQHNTMMRCCIAQHNMHDPISFSLEKCVPDESHKILRTTVSAALDPSSVIQGSKVSKWYAIGDNLHQFKGELQSWVHQHRTQTETRFCNEEFFQNGSLCVQQCMVASTPKSKHDPLSDKLHAVPPLRLLSWWGGYDLLASIVCDELHACPMALFRCCVYQHAKPGLVIWSQVKKPTEHQSPTAQSHDYQRRLPASNLLSADLFLMQAMDMKQYQHTLTMRSWNCQLRMLVSGTFSTDNSCRALQVLQKPGSNAPERLLGNLQNQGSLLEIQRCTVAPISRKSSCTEMCKDVLLGCCDCQHHNTVPEDRNKARCSKHAFNSIFLVEQIVDLHYVKGIGSTCAIPCECGFNYMHDIQLIRQFFQIAFCDEVKRVGEATNPGPFVIATFNPTQLLGREEEVATFNDGIWTACETSHTSEAQGVISSRFRALQVNTRFSKAVQKHSENQGIFRGKAVGTAVMSRFPMQPYPEALEAEADATCRFTDAIIRVKPNLPVYTCAIYGPPENNTTLVDAEKVFVAAAKPGVERATSFKGPAVITGDLNKELHEVPFWPLLQRKGWVDCAMLCHQRFGTPLHATCRDRTRKSFILANPIIAQYLTDCKTINEHMFDSHPVLQATFEIDASIQYRQVWSLPRSLDDQHFDAEKFNISAIAHCDGRKWKFQNALNEKDADEAIRQFAITFEESAVDACIDAEGNPAVIPQDCKKKCRSRIKKLAPIVAPVLKQGGSGDFTVPVCQPSISIRRHVKQLRRVQSLHRQLEAHERGGTEDSNIKCQQLWLKICSANGFKHGFQHWVLWHFGMFVPTVLPTSEYAQELYMHFQQFVQEEVAHERQARSSFRRLQLLEDIGGGGRTIFRSVRDPTPPPPSYISFKKCQKIQKQRWKKEGNHRILYQGQCVLDAGLPIQFQGQSTMLETIHDKYFIVNPPLVCRDLDDLQIHQDCHTADPREMQDHVATAWGEMWQCRESDDAQKQTVAELITSLGDCPTCPYKPFCIDNWKNMMKGVKCRSSRGACGFSMLDVKRMPEVLLEWLFCIYRAVETGMQWPQRLTLARVAMLAKPGESAHRPLGIRPITILSVLYRLWSRYRSLQVLEFLGQNIPPQVGGIASKLSADALSAWVGDIIDVAHSSNQHKCGLVIDLQKCFNLVPRWPLKQLLSQLGIPQEYSTAHLAMLANLNRHIEIAGQIGDEVPSTCGIPEGCAASVYCMVALTVLAANAMQKVCPSVQVSMFADNWAVITETIRTLQRVIQTLENLVDCLHMKLAPSKSWLWGTSQELRKGLRRLTMSGQTVPVMNSAKDLGCDIAYTKQVSKKTSLGRLKKSLRVLHRVKQRKIPKQFLGRLCTSVGVGIISYGSEMVRFTNKQFHSLRCAIASSLGLYKSGANTMLSIGATGLTVDPQVRLLRRRIKFFRKFFKIFPCRQAGFLQRITKHVSKTRVSGLAAVFHCTMRDARWKCEEHAEIVHDSGIRCNWAHDAIPYVFQCLDKAWEATIPTRIDRKGFDLDALSSKGFQTAIKHRGPQQQGLLVAYASGKHVTMDALSHYARDDSSCPFCSALDGKEHRALHCQGLQDLRKKHLEAIKWVLSQPKAVMHIGLVPDSNDAVLLRQQVFNHGFQFVLPDGASCGSVFTDGSCFNNSSWEHAVAGSATIQVTGEYQWQLIQREVLPTPDHSSYRSEVYAVVLALQSFWTVHIFSDCAAVVEEIQRMNQERAHGVNISVRTHHDLWSVVAWHLQHRCPGEVQITKVKAHIDWQVLEHGVARQRAYFNAMVDMEAKKAVAADNFEIWQQFERMFERKQGVLQGIKKYHDFIWDVHERSFNALPRQRPCVVQPSFADLWNFQGAGKVILAPCQHDIDECPFGRRFALRVRDWWQQIHWYVGSPVTVIEAYMDFCFESNSQMPVRMSDNVWRLREDSVEADVSTLRLGLQAHAWLRFLRWWLGCIQCPDLQIVRSNAMFTYGPTITTWSIRLRPKLLHGERVSSELWQYLHSNGITARNFKKPWSPLSSKTEHIR